MARYLILFLGLLFFGCEIHSQQIIKPEKLDFSQIKFDSVTKKLIDESSVDVKEADDMKKIINYWFDNKIKTDGFDGSLNVYLKEIVINKTSDNKYFKFEIDVFIDFEVLSDGLNKKKIFNIRSSEFGQINGSFSINDQENLTLNVMYKVINSITKKLKDLN
jgi:hypothetical protein